MAEIARRSFLFGMAATLASVAVAKPSLLITPPVLMPAPLPFKVKHIHELMIVSDAEAAYRHAAFSLSLGDRKLLQGVIAPGGYYRWAGLGEAIIQREGEVLRVDLGGSLAEAIIYSAVDGVGIVETYKLGKPAAISYLAAKDVPS